MALALGDGPLCANCAYRRPCGAARLPEACRPTWGARTYGGVNALHPLNPDTAAHLAEVGGPEFSDIAVRPQPDLALPALVHQIRLRTALRGELGGTTYAIGPQAAWSRRRVKSAEHVRSVTGLRPDQKLGLVLFGRDRLLEELWPRRVPVARAIASAGFDFCVPPSFANYGNRPRTEYLFNVRRSLVFFGLLQDRGVHAIPRLAWLFPHDVERFAAWANENLAVRLVALDIASSSAHDWRKELELLVLFDRLTGCRLAYVLHGPSVIERCVDLYRALGTTRVHIANSRAIARPAIAGTSFRERLQTEQQVVDAAQRVVLHETTTDHPAASASGTPGWYPR
jgi:hypothetical protein